MSTPERCSSKRESVFSLANTLVWESRRTARSSGTHIKRLLSTVHLHNISTQPPMTSALARAMLLTIRAVSIQAGYTSPTPKPAADEQSKFLQEHQNKMGDSGPFTILHAAKVTKVRVQMGSVQHCTLTNIVDPRTSSQHCGACFRSRRLRATIPSHVPLCASLDPCTA